MREMRAIAFVSKLIEEESLDAAKYKRIHVHSIRDDREMETLGVATKLNPDWEFLTRLRDVGRARAAAWLEHNHAAIGQTSTIDIGETFL